MSRRSLCFFVGCVLFFTVAVSAGAEPGSAPGSETSFWAEVWAALVETVDTTIGADEVPATSGQEIAPEEPDDPEYGPHIDHLG